MKKRIFAILLIFVFIFGFSCNAFAISKDDENLSTRNLMFNDLGLLGGAFWGIGQSLGFASSFTSGTAAGAQLWAETQINDYASEAGMSIIDLFGVGPVTQAATGILVTQMAYNELRNVWDWIKNKFSLDQTEKNVQQGLYDDEVLPFSVDYIETEFGNYSFIYSNPRTLTANYGGSSLTKSGYGKVSIYKGGVYKGDIYNSDSNTIFNHLNVYYSSPYLKLDFYTDRVVSREWYFNNYGGGTTLETNPVITNSIKMTSPVQDELPYAESWQQFAGNIPDIQSGMTLDDIISLIYSNVASNDLIISGEIIDIAPAPTPAPVPPSPYPQAQTELEGINTNIDQLNDMLQDAFDLKNQLDTVINSGNETVEGLNDLIGQSQDVIEGINDLTDALEGVGTATDAIAASAEAVESLTGSISDALDIISSTDASDYKFDLRTLFPFCIPFDVVRILKAFDATTRNATAPHIRIPMNFGSVIGMYTWDLDFAVFDPVAAILRQAELLVFAVGLAIATNKMIRW